VSPFQSFLLRPVARRRHSGCLLKVTNNEEGKRTGRVLDSETHLAICIIRFYILGEVLRAGCSLSHTIAALGFLPAATQVIDRDKTMFLSERCEVLRLAKILNQSKYPDWNTW